MKMVTEPEILLVDDEASIRLTLPLMLQSYGFKVSSAATVTEALRLMAEHRFDVLISDMNIDRPGDGFTVASAMRSTQPHAVRFILTGYPDIDSVLKALREDVDDYLIKPTEIEELVARITSRVQNRTLRQATELKRLSEIVRRETEFITLRWLELAKDDAELSSVRLSDPERTDHMPALLQLTVQLLAGQGQDISADNRTAARGHGETRYRQGVKPNSCKMR